MALIVRATSPLATASSNAADTTKKPGAVWSERFELSDEAQKVLNGSALLKVKDGKLCLDMDTVNKLAKYNVETKDVLSRFRDSLRGEHVPEVQSSPGNKSPVTMGIAKANGVGWGRPAAQPEQHSRPPLGVYNKRKAQETCIECQPAAKELKVEENSPEEYEQLTRKVEFMEVPIAASAGDRLTLLDTANKKMTKVYIRIPTDAHDGMPMDNLKPPGQFKVLVVDGSGFKAGGSLVDQHAARLHTHRSRCKDCMCNVLGCNGDDSYDLFKNASSEETKALYERHWVVSNRLAIRARGNSMRMRASCL